MKKKSLIVLILVLVLAFSTGCGGSSGGGEAPKEPEKIEKPVAEGVEKNIEGLNFFIPEGFTDNPYNGGLGVWDFYTGVRTGDELNVDVIVTWSGNYTEKNLTAKEYIEQKSVPAKAIKLTSVTEETINGRQWYVFHNDNAYYYAAEFGENIYEVKVEKNRDPEGKYEALNELVKSTLFFTEEEAK